MGVRQGEGSEAEKMTDGGVLIWMFRAYYHYIPQLRSRCCPGGQETDQAARGLFYGSYFRNGLWEGVGHEERSDSLLREGPPVRLR